MGKTNQRVTGCLAALVGGALIALSGAALAESAVSKGSKAAAVDECVAPTPDMRRNHMVYLKHERDETVHSGIRGRKFSLAGCVDCHAAQDPPGVPVPINGEGQFCESCHEFAAVNIDCFGCHRNTPQVPSAAFFHSAAGNPDAGSLTGVRAVMNLSEAVEAAPDRQP